MLSAGGIDLRFFGDADELYKQIIYRMKRKVA